MKHFKIKLFAYKYKVQKKWFKYKNKIIVQNTKIILKISKLHIYPDPTQNLREIINLGSLSIADRLTISVLVY